MKFYFKPVDAPQKAWEGQPLVDQLIAMLASSDHPRYKVASSAAGADIIVLIESNSYKDGRYINRLAADSDFQRRPEECFTLNYDDDAIGILPGCYAGIGASRFDARRHRATCYLLPSDDRIEGHYQSHRQTPAHLLSFRGAASHRVREGIFAAAGSWSKLGPITRMTRWFDHSEEEKDSYLREILDSQYVLCPRGIAPASHRLFEVMQLGRVPVILADAWVPPVGPAWPACSLRIAESRVASLPTILMERQAEAEEMGRRARQEWEQWFSPERRMVVAAAALEDLMLARPTGLREAGEFARWRTRRRWWRMRWMLPQRVVRKLGKKVWPSHEWG